MRRLAVFVAFAGLPAILGAQSTTVTLNGTQVAVTQTPNGQPVRDNRPQTGTSSVSGRIVSDTGQPMRRVIVQLQGALGPHATPTDLDGRYEFTNLPAGHYTISANHTGYILTRSDGFDLADNQHLEDVNIRLAHGAVITGQITDEFGDPLIGANVAPMRQQFMNGQRRLINAGMVTQTNDIGEYRLFGLQPGVYYLSVSPRNESITSTTTVSAGAPGATLTSTTTTSPPTGYAPTYYPGTNDMTSAQPITVAPSQTLSNVSFSLSAVKLSKVSGFVFDDQGRPVTRGSVMAMPRSGAIGGAGGTGGPIRQDGAFTISNVPPGSYYVRATISPVGPVAPPSPGLPPTPPQVAIAPVTVSGDDISGVVLMPMSPAIVRGRVTFDDFSAAASVKASTVRVVAQRVDPNGPALVSIGPNNTQVQDDFTFETLASPEPSLLRATVQNSTRGPADVIWRLRAVYVRGQDVTDTVVELQPGQALDDVEFAMTTRVQTVSGTVAMPDGSPAKNMTVVVFPADRDRWTMPASRFNGRASTGNDGTYKILSLPPGSYYVLAVANNLSPAPDWSDPDVLETSSRTASRFSIAEGGTAVIDLTLSR